MLGRVALLSIGSATVAVGGISTAVYLSKNKTLKNRAEEEGLKLIKYEDLLSWKTAFQELKSGSEVIIELKKIDPSISNSSDLNKGGEALRGFCKSSLEKPKSSNNDLFEKIKSWCIKLPLTIKDKFLNLGKEIESNWSSKFGSIKTGNSDGLESDLKDVNSEITKTLSDLGDEENKFVKALEDWCNSNMKKNLIDSDSVFKKVEKRCLKNG